MQPLTFPCPACGRLMGVGMESAGRPVRCPHCLQVVTAPTPPAPTPSFAPPAGREGAESILGDPEESEDGLFGSAAQRTVDLPPTQPIPIPPYLPTAPPQYVPATGPFQAPAVAPNETFEPTDAATPAARRAARERNAGQSRWKETALAGLAIYALAMTGIAAIGWTRKPAASPAPPTIHQPTSPPTPIVKPKK